MHVPEAPLERRKRTDSGDTEIPSDSPMQCIKSINGEQSSYDAMLVNGLPWADWSLAL